MNVRAKEKDVQRVVYRRGGRKGGGPSFGKLIGNVSELDAPKFSRGGRADGIPGSRGEEIDAVLTYHRTVYFGELHLQQHLLRTHRAKRQHVDHILGIGIGNHSCALGNVFRGNMPGQYDGGTRRGNDDLLFRKDTFFFFCSGAYVHIYAQIKAARALEFVPYQKRDLARSPAVHQNLGWCDHKGIRHTGVSD